MARERPSIPKLDLSQASTTSTIQNKSRDIWAVDSRKIINLGRIALPDSVRTYTSLNPDSHPTLYSQLSFGRPKTDRTHVREQHRMRQLRQQAEIQQKSDEATKALDDPPQHQQEEIFQQISMSTATPIMSEFTRRIDLRAKSARGLGGHAKQELNFGYRANIKEHVDLREVRLKNKEQQQQLLDGGGGNNNKTINDNTITAVPKKKQYTSDNQISNIYKKEGKNIREILMALNETNMEYLSKEFSSQENGLLSGPQFTALLTKVMMNPNFADDEDAKKKKIAGFGTSSSNIISENDDDIKQIVNSALNITPKNSPRPFLGNSNENSPKPTAPNANNSKRVSLLPMGLSGLMPATATATAATTTAEAPTPPSPAAAEDFRTRRRTTVGLFNSQQRFGLVANALSEAEQREATRESLLAEKVSAPESAVTPTQNFFFCLFLKVFISNPFINTLRSALRSAAQASSLFRKVDVQEKNEISWYDFTDYVVDGFQYTDLEKVDSIRPYMATHTVNTSYNREIDRLFKIDHGPAGSLVVTERGSKVSERIIFSRRGYKKMR